MHAHIFCISLQATGTFEICDSFISVQKKKALFFSIKNILKVWNCQKPWQNKEINNNILFAVKDKIFILEYDQNYIFRNT